MFFYQISTLTTGIDTLKGESTDDFFDGSAAIMGGVTLQSFDKLDGGAGYDTVVAQGLGAFSTNVDTFKNIESVKFVGQTTGTTIDLTQTTGLENIEIANAAGGVTVSGINAGVKTLGVTGNATAGEDTYTFTASNVAVAGAEDAVTLKLAGLGTADASDAVTVQPTSGVNGYETITIDNVQNNFITLDDGTSTSLKTVKSTGAADLDMTITPATLTSFDASAATGKQTIDLSANTQNITVKGGAADDSFAMGTHLTKEDVIDGGKGSNTLSFASANTTLSDTFQVSNIQTLQVTDALNANLDVSKFGTAVNTVRLDVASTAARTISKLAANSTLDLQAAQTVVHTLSLADATGKEDQINIALHGDYSDAAPAADALNFGTVKADGVEKMTLLSTYSEGGNPDHNEDHATLTLEAAQLKDLTITGTVGVTLGTVGANLQNIDSTGLVAEFAYTSAAAAGMGGISVNLGTGINQTTTVLTGNGNNVIVSGAGSDTITTGNGVDHVTLGTGDDTVKLGAGNDILTVAAADLTKLDSVDGGEGTDVLTLITGGTVSDEAFTNVKGFESITGTGGVAFNLNLGTHAAAAFTGNVIRIDQAATADQVWNVNASTLTSGQSLDFRGASATAETADTIIGGDGNDIIAGGVNATAAANVMTGDTLKGGAGADTFFFRTMAEANGGAVAGDTNNLKMDHILDFNAAGDKIQIATSAFASSIKVTDAATAGTKGADVASASYATIEKIQDAFTADQLAATTATSVGWNVIEATGAMLGKYLIVDLDGKAGFLAASDMIINITGVEGTIGAGNFDFGNLPA